MAVNPYTHGGATANRNITARPRTSLLDRGLGAVGIQKPRASLLDRGLRAVGLNRAPAGAYANPAPPTLPPIGGGTLPPVGPALTYAVAPAPPTAAEHRAWDETIRYSTEDYALAMARAEAQRLEADVLRAANARGIARDYMTRNQDARTQAGSASMALSPSTMGRLARVLRESQAEAAAQNQTSYADAQRSALDSVALARRNRDRAIDSVNAERAFVGGDNTRLLSRVYG